ncbi:MAG: SDR family oxidoreductase [Solirubrobacteraceae bacterium]
MSARALVVGDGPLAAATATELTRNGFAIASSNEAAAGPLQVLVVTSSGASDVLDIVRRHQEGLASTGLGRVVLVGSRDWLGWPGRVDGAAASAELVGLTRSLALELGPQGITVNLVCPPGPSTDAPKEDPWAAPPPPLTGPIGDDDVAFAIAFAADERSGYFTGQVLHVSGGLSVLSSLTA